MITNDRQYQITRTAAREFEEVLARLDTVESHRSPKLRQAMREAMESQLEELREQLADYEATRYAGVNLERIQAVVEALGVKIRERVIFPTAGREELARSGE